MKNSVVKKTLQDLLDNLNKIDDDREILFYSLACGYESGDFPLDDLVSTVKGDLNDPEDQVQIEFWFQTEIID